MLVDNGCHISLSSLSFSDFFFFFFVTKVNCFKEKAFPVEAEYSHQRSSQIYFFFFVKNGFDAISSTSKQT